MMAVCVSSGVTILYTLVGNMVAVAYTDVLQLALISAGLVGCGSNAEMVQQSHKIMWRVPVSYTMLSKPLVVMTPVLR